MWCITAWPDTFFYRISPHVFKIRIIADMEERVAEEVKRENITSEKARYILKKDDDERRRWSLQLYGIDTWDCQLYDMVLHIKTITVDDAVEMICRAIQSDIFKTTPESRKILDDLLLAAEIKAAVVKIVPMLNVVADNGVVRISNIEVSQKVKPNVLAQIKAVAEKMAGVKQVIFSGTVKRRRLSQCQSVS